MGYANVFCLREAPIRQRIADTGNDEALAEEVGAAVLDLTVRDGLRGIIEGGAEADVRPLLGTDEALQSVGSFQTYDVVVVIWTGNRLVAFPDLDAGAYRCLTTLDEQARTERFVPRERTGRRASPMQRHRRRTAGQEEVPSSGEQGGAVSFYWMYEDFARRYADTPRPERPHREVGEAMLRLMLSAGRSEALRGHSNAVSRAGTLVGPELAAFLWSRNWMQRLADVDAERRAEVAAWLEEEA